MESASTVSPLTSLTPELKTAVQEDTFSRLRSIIGANVTTRYASLSSSLADFRKAIVGKNIDEDVTVVDDFRNLIPLTDYESYCPFVTKFFDRPCKLSEVQDLLAPGLPTFICVSSSTSSNEPKRFPKYPRTMTGPVIAAPPETGTIVAIFSLGYKDVLEVATDSGEIAYRIPVSPGSVWYWRTYRNWSVETDATRMRTIRKCAVDGSLSRMSNLFSPKPCCSMGNEPNQSPSAVHVDACTVRAGRSTCGTNPY